MCYSAEVQEDYRWYIRTFGAKISIADFVHLYTARLADSKIRIAKAMDAAFAHPKSNDERKIKALIDEYETSQAAKLEQELFKQKKRLADAQRVLKANGPQMRVVVIIPTGEAAAGFNASEWAYLNSGVVLQDTKMFGLLHLSELDQEQVLVGRA